MRTTVTAREAASAARCGPAPFTTCRHAPSRQPRRLDAPAEGGSPAGKEVVELWQRATRPLAAGLLAATLLLAPPALAAPAITLSDGAPVADLARVIPSGKLDGVQQQLLALERDTGWRVRVLTLFDRSTAPSVEQIRSQWHVDDKTVVVLVDPTSPNILSFKYGLAVQREVLPRPFFTELQARFGSMFAVRDSGEAAAVQGVLDSLDTCLRRPGGCAVVPGLSSDQYSFTLLTSVAGGCVCGAVLRIDPVGIVQRRWVWALLFSPLWGTLSISFGIGPLVSRTDDPLPIAGNLAATVVAAALVYFYPQATKAVGLTVDED